MKPALGPQIDLGDDAELIALLEERETLTREVKARQHRLQEIRSVLVERLGEAAYGRVANWEVFWVDVWYRPQPEQLRRFLWARRLRNKPPREVRSRRRRPRR
jgi:hypothetical protein